MAASVRNLVAPKSARSHVWNHFGFVSDDLGNVVDKTCVYCKLCNARIAYCGNTTNMSLHLSRCLKTAGMPEDSQSPLPLISLTPMSITRALVEFIARDLWPLELAEGPGFYKLLTVSNQPSYMVPSIQCLAAEIVTIANDKRKVLADELNSISHVFLSVEEWKSVHGDCYTSASCHYIDANWNLRSRFLDAGKLLNTSSVENVANNLNCLIDKWGIREKIVAVLVKDSESVVARAFESIGLDVILCTLNLLTKCIQRGLEVPMIKDLMAKTQNIALYFKEHEQSLQSLQKLCVGKGFELTEAEMHENLKLLEHCKAEVNSLVPEELAVTVEESSFIPQLRSVLEPLTEAIGYLGANKPACASVILPLFHNLEKTLQQSQGDCPQVRRFKEAVASVAGSHRYQSNSLLCASALDPRFKSLKFLQSQVDRDEIWTKLQAEVALNDKYPECRMNQSLHLIRLLTDEEEEVISSAERYWSQVHRYLAELKSVEEPLNWWKRVMSHYPLLAGGAKKYLAMLAVVPSNGGDRRQMLGAAAEDILFLHEYLTQNQDATLVLN